MRCPFCLWADSKVVDSRDVDDTIRRRRECLNPECGARFTTYERVQTSALFIVKKDGRREEFSREKLLAGLRKACEKRPLDAGAVERVAADIESALYGANEPEVQSGVLGDLVMERLRALDPIAYVRFASVYRDFRDVAELQEELAALTDSRTPAGQLPLLDSAAVAAPSLRLRPAAPMERTRTRRPVRPVQTPVPMPGRDDAPRVEPKKRKRG
jgi:transcriptional repressor NrdR